MPPCCIGLGWILHNTCLQKMCSTCGDVCSVNEKSGSISEFVREIRLLHPKIGNILQNAVHISIVVKNTRIDSKGGQYLNM